MAYCVNHRWSGLVNWRLSLVFSPAQPIPLGCVQGLTYLKPENHNPNHLLSTPFYSNFDPSDFVIFFERLVIIRLFLRWHAEANEFKLPKQIQSEPMNKRYSVHQLRDKSLNDRSKKWSFLANFGLFSNIWLKNHKKSTFLRILVRKNIS